MKQYGFLINLWFQTYSLRENKRGEETVPYLEGNLVGISSIIWSTKIKLPLLMNQENSQEKSSISSSFLTQNYRQSKGVMHLRLL